MKRERMGVLEMSLYTVFPYTLTHLNLPRSPLGIDFDKDLVKHHNVSLSI